MAGSGLNKILIAFILLGLFALVFVFVRVYAARNRELPVQKSSIEIGAYDPQILAPTSPWQTVSAPPQAGEVQICTGGECANVKARPGDQLLIGSIGGLDNISQITVNGVRVHAEQRGNDLVITVP